MAAAGCCMLLAVAGCCWLLLLRARTGMHEPACMLLQQQQLLLLRACVYACMRACVYACMRACVAAFVIDTIIIPADTSAQTRAWRIEFPYRNIRGESIRTKGRVRGTVPRARPFVRIDSSRIFLYENLIIHARPQCTFVVGRPNIPVLIYMLTTSDIRSGT
jgi:hypothetical protein